ncbi:unnamed protein product [Parascedosporium putredinis]|uniref:Ankyrin n=1 Tax=Parascedosporium putredinis TaxID=1442378 RepID=A0A9P1HCZ8_9PEZI|nr:unnamed protein product [Parascedosporium putredinis]CAI8004946.1 unnamed protein product [Parascedosporium putredinis]
MESSASPSGASSHATQTGRPSLWTDSDQRKLGRLYVYTTLPIRKILDVIQASSPDAGPGKDSANKKLNALLDKEPRWLHPRTRTDMELPSPSDAQHFDPNPVSPVNGPSWDTPPANGAVLAQNGPYAYDRNSLRIDPTATTTAAHFQNTPFPLIPLATLPTNSNFLRRGTAMTTSTERTTTTLRRALSGYSSGFVTHVKRVVKRYTMPVQPGQNNSPIAEQSDSASGSRRDSWVHDAHSPPERTGTPFLPGDYLVIDALVHKQGHCFEDPPNINLTAVSATRPLSDIFGNFLMHFLIARDVDHFYILQLVSANVNCRQRNHAGQTFLHLLNPTWLHDPNSGLGPLTTLLRAFGQDLPFLLARDCYGRTFFHVLLSNIGDPTPLNQLLESSEFTLLRDAFGSIPGYQAPMHLQPLRRAITSVMHEDTPMAAYEQPSLPAVEPDLVSSQARLLEFVNRARNDPKLEDPNGRNGLHCLAAAILSNTSLLRKAGGVKDDSEPAATRQEDVAESNKKRKRDAPASLKHEDSSKGRLELREKIVDILLDANVNVNHYDLDGNTVLMAFVAQLPEDDDYKVPVSILELLIKAGADVNARNRRGETALHIAVRRGRKLAMRTLVQHRANVHVRDAAGRSVLDVADEMVRAGDSGGNKAYMHYEACRAWLSGQGLAVQNPSVIQEWGTPGLAQRR